MSVLKIVAITCAIVVFMPTPSRAQTATPQDRCWMISYATMATDTLGNTVNTGWGATGYKKSRQFASGMPTLDDVLKATNDAGRQTKALGQLVPLSVSEIACDQ